MTLPHAQVLGRMAEGEGFEPPRGLLALRAFRIAQSFRSRYCHSSLACPKTHRERLRGLAQIGVTHDRAAPEARLRPETWPGRSYHTALNHRGGAGDETGGAACIQTH